MQIMLIEENKYEIQLTSISPQATKVTKTDGSSCTYTKKPYELPLLWIGQSQLKPKSMKHYTLTSST